MDAAVLAAIGPVGSQAHSFPRCVSLLARGGLSPPVGGRRTAQGSPGTLIDIEKTEECDDSLRCGNKACSVVVDVQPITNRYFLHNMNGHPASRPLHLRGSCCHVDLDGRVI